MNEPFYLDAAGVYRARMLEELPWLMHGFGTALSKDWLKCSSVSTVRQIHSDKILVAGEGCVGEGDALISDREGVCVSIRTADCLPVLIADPVRRAVGAVHAGWRGTVAGIARKAVEEMGSRYGSAPQELRVAIGPGIARCCFEVGPEVASQFGAFPFGDFVTEWDKLGEKAHVDLVEANRRQLRQAGVRDEFIAASGLCTFCGGAGFESYRRDREKSGRMVSAIGLRGQEEGAGENPRL